MAFKTRIVFKYFTDVLKRELTQKERDFIKWIVSREEDCTSSQ
jgi:hypothetical protein